MLLHGSTTRYLDRYIVNWIDRLVDALYLYPCVQVLRLDVTFQEIMRQYRHQPQAKSHVSYVKNGAHVIVQ